jgi:hypothetical protein
MIYQLRNKQTGKWYNGSQWGSDIESGKAYSSLGKVRAAITRLINADQGIGKKVIDYEVVIYDVVKVSDIQEIVTPKKLLELLTKSR